MRRRRVSGYRANLLILDEATDLDPALLDAAGDPPPGSIVGTVDVTPPPRRTR